MMRKLILTVLLATTAAMPALAQDGSSDRRRDRGEQSEAREARQEARAAQRAERAERSQRAERAERPERAERQRRPDATVEVVQRAEVAVEPQRRQYRATDRRGERSIIGQVIEQNRERRGEVVVNRDHDRDGRYDRRRSDSSRQWSNHWRRDRTYDWRRHRDHNRSVFRLGRYYDPYRYGYRRFSIGFSLFPSYYRSNYWLNDPWMYRLPPAYGPYRWVRYYNDALLVNIYTGQVVDVEYDFFW